MDEASSAAAWRSRPANADDLGFVHAAELDYIREREPEREAATKPISPEARGEAYKLCRWC